ncbi:MAG: uroporphyrinogen decarboxylase [Pirellulales bacterium]|nr:uroporphyrinogen decarboxylase [Pirellulales bacterium]
MTEVAPDFAGLQVAAFESRRAEELGRLIEKFGGVPHVSPSMREVPLAENPEAVALARRLIAGEFDLVIFMTGVGTNMLGQQIEGQVSRDEFLDALRRVTTVARGPKPVAVLKQWGVEPTYRIPEPNTWRDLLDVLDREVPLDGRRVAVQEYGVSNRHLLVGLAARGARAEPLVTYRWELPADVAPLEANARALAAGERQVVLFTSSNQVHNLLAVAERLRIEPEVRAGLSRAVVASIGPTMSETLRELGLPVDLEPEHPKMGHLVREAAERSAGILARKAQLAARLEAVTTATAPAQAAWYDSPFMRATRLEPVPYTPIWLMRQAGRYLPEYRAIRSRVSFLELCKDPALSAEVMINSVARLGVDAAIIFSDLLPILEPLGFDLEFAAGEGPVIHNPVRAAADVDRVLELESVDSLSFVMETVRQTRAGLPAHLPVIGFAGAPFTLASYAIEGGSSRNYLHTKTLMYGDEGAWQAILGRLARAVTRYLNAQIAAGAQAVQLFDSWVGCLGPDDYRRYVLPFTRAVIEGVTPGVPVINFATGNPSLLPLLAEAGGAVIGADWRIEIDEAWRLVGHDRAIQGNLDPLVLLAEPAYIRDRAEAILRRVGGRAGHIFNLGHGVLPQTPVDHVRALIDAVHELSQQAVAGV